MLPAEQNNQSVEKKEAKEINKGLLNLNLKLKLKLPSEFKAEKKESRGINKELLKHDLKLEIPSENGVSLSDFITDSGTFIHGDLVVNKDGVRVISHTESESTPLIQPSDNEMSLSDFELVRFLGQGSGGIVHLVQHKWTAQFFAIKVIRMNIDESARTRTAQELKIHLSSHCPYVVVCYQCFYDNGAISIVLEYMDGGSLAHFLKKVKRIPEPYLAAICKQVLKGLWYLHHERRVLHRDIKPSNLLINHRGQVKISDFGVSKLLTRSSSLANTFVGTYSYMSPERITGGNFYGYKSDIWSLGLVILECATGSFPYSKDVQLNHYELMEAIVCHPTPCAPEDLFSEELCSFILACVQKDPKDRLSTNELMAHPFISKYDDLEVDLGHYFTSAASAKAVVH